MSTRKRGRWYWADFSVDGVRYRTPLRTGDWKVARQRERDLIEAARAGHLTTQHGPKRLHDAIDRYLAAKVMRCAPRTVELERERLSLVTQHFGDVRFSALTREAIAGYKQARHDAGIANRTFNMDVGALRRVLKHCGRWRALHDHVANLPEQPSAIGRALTRAEQQRLFDAAASNPEWEHVYCAATLAANTSMRPVEVKHLRRRDVDLFVDTVTVAHSKNVTSDRVIPLNQPARKAISRMMDRADALAFVRPDDDLWPACQWGRFDPTRPIRKWDTAWRALRGAAGLPGLRFHDLRHTIITELAEMGVPDHVIESITGHLSRRMLEHYSHVRLEAKRQALEALDARRAEPDVAEAPTRTEMIQ